VAASSARAIGEVVNDDREALAELAAHSPIKKIRVLAWRDLDDPEAGGSELHMDEVLRRWADAGVRVDARTSAVVGQPSRIRRHGYFVERSGGRYQVFPQSFLRGWRHDRYEYDALVEIWNGIPFFGPLWFRGPRLTLLHHVHSEMWRMTVPGPLANFGWWVERRLAPLFYRHGTLATLSESSALDIAKLLSIRNAVVVPVGISEFYSPGGERSKEPLVVAVGRLVPVKQFDQLISEFLKVRAAVPTAALVIVGEGHLRLDLEAQIAQAQAGDWITLVGHVSDDELRDLYRRAWLVTSNSLREGWGMSITEAAACATPSVVVDIAGHRDAVRPGESGVLVAKDQSLAEQIVKVLEDPTLLNELRTGALAYAATLSWDSVALRLFQLLGSRRR
jgi:glycosyltransferase involved in cell wall biosynthesis